jgi:hypothetical protein
MGDTRLIRPFGGFLGDQRNGKLAAELAEALNTVVEAVMANRKEGKLRLTIKIKPTDMTGVLAVSDDVSVTLPSPQKDAAMFFADKDFNLMRSDPNQLEMGIVREVPDADIRELRQVNDK